MRKLEKLPEPLELIENKDHWKQKVAEEGTEYYKTRYRVSSIKDTLKSETFDKCVYCESKIGHNTPGDIEHKIPTSVNEDGRFEWSNLTIACTECNRRKNDYYEETQMFIDPYTHNVEELLIHFGILVFSKPGEQIAEISVRILELSEIERRKVLFAQKLTKVKAANNLMERIASMQNTPLKKQLIDDLLEMADKSSEYSAMVKSLVEIFPGPWAD